MQIFPLGKGPRDFIKGKPIKADFFEDITVITNANVDAHDYDIQERARMAKARA